jgi:hypothetical protein
MDWAFRALTLGLIPLVSAGFCIYREHLPIREILEIALCSACLSAGVFGIQFISSFEQVLGLLLLLAVSSVLYLKEIAIPLVIIADLLKHMQRDGQVIAKLRLARIFAGGSTAVNAGTLALSMWCVLLGVQPSNRAIVVEFCTLANVYMEAKCFLFRQSYCGRIFQKTQRVRPFRPKILTVMSPVESFLAVSLNLTHPSDQIRNSTEGTARPPTSN